MTTLWKIANGKLQKVSPSSLSAEEKLESWIAEDPSILGLDIMLIGRQVTTDYGGRIDLLGISREGDLVIVELKRDRTPRDVVAQVLDYASWVSKLTTKAVHDLAFPYLGQSLPKAFRQHFDAPLPDNLNTSHKMVIVAGSLDPSSQRIVEYLAEECGIRINTAFFTFFNDGGAEYLSADWLMAEEEDDVIVDPRKAPWSGVWYANAGDGSSRSWDDMVKYGFLAAGGGPKYSGALNRLNVGDPVFAYQGGAGYVGFGVVSEKAVMVKDFLVDGQTLLSLPLKQPNLAHDKDDPELAEYAVSIQWKKTFPLNEAKSFEGMFANPNVVCRLSKRQTIDFLNQAFGTSF